MPLYWNNPVKNPRVYGGIYMDNCVQISDKIRQAVMLKTEIDDKKKRLAEIQKELAASAQYKEGCATGHIYTEHYHVKIALKKNIKWDQKKLESARASLGDDRFFKIFGWKFEPKSKAALDGFLDNADEQYTAPVLSAMTVSDGVPSVSYEEIGA